MMQSVRKTISEKWFVLSPVLYAVYPVLFLYFHNVHEVMLSQVVLPLACAFIFSLLLWFVLSFALKDHIKAAIITTVIVILFHTYGLLFDWLVTLDLFVIKHRYILPVLLVAMGYVSYFIALCNNRDFLRNIAKILTVVVVIALVLSIVPLASYSKGLIHPDDQREIPRQTVIRQDLTENLPDIYYFILDEYASPDTMRSVYNYDTSDFTEHLEKKGFYIARNSSTRYHQTLFSLATSLNMAYPGKKISHEEFWQIAGKQAAYDYAGCSETELASKINDNNVTRFLKEKGYKIVVIDNYYGIIPAKGMMKADLTYNYAFEKNFSVLDSFSRILIRNSMLRPFEFVIHQSGGGLFSDIRQGTLFTLTKIPEIKKIPGPKFVFIHLLCPHSPFVLDQNGGQVDVRNALNWKDPKYYRNQYIFISKKMDSVVNELLDTSSDNTVIIIQSDHGPRASDCVRQECLDIPIDDQFRIFNAYYLSDDCKKYLYQNISPVNSFRLIFNCYFKTNYSFLEDG